MTMPETPENQTSGMAPEPGTPPDHKDLGPVFQELCEIIAKLRSPSGCPWDREQTLDSLKSNLIEETYEVIDAIEGGDRAIDGCEQVLVANRSEGGLVTGL